MPKVYGIEHILFLLIVTIISTFSLILLKKYIKNEKKQKIVIIIFAIIHFSLVVWNRLAVNEYNLNLLKLLPTSFCGTTSFVFPFCIVFCKKDSKILQFASSCALLGGIVTLAYPDFIGQDASIFYDKTITGLLHHVFLVYNFILICIFGRYKPSMKNWNSLILGLCCYMTYGVFSITIIGNSDAMVIYNPLLPGSIFNWFVTGILFIILYTICLLIYERIAFKKENRWLSNILNKFKKNKNNHINDENI